MPKGSQGQKRPADVSSAGRGLGPKIPAGFIGRINGARVTGWAADVTGDEGTKTVVEFYLGGRLIHSMEPNLPRHQLFAAGYPLTTGFVVTLPLPVGTHTISAKTRHSQHELKGSPFECTILSCPTLTPEIRAAKTETAGSEGDAPGNKSETLRANGKLLLIGKAKPEGLPEASSAVPVAALDRVFEQDNGEASDRAEPSCVDMVFLSESGAAFITGWALARSSGIRSLQLTVGEHRLELNGSKLGRYRRRDVETALSLPSGRDIAFLGLVNSGTYSYEPFTYRKTCVVTIEFENGYLRKQTVDVNRLDDASFRQTVLHYFATVEFCGNKRVGIFRLLDNYVGDEIIRFNAWYTRRLAASAFCQRFGTMRKVPKASIIVCLYGKPEYQFLHDATFGLCPSAPELEFIYVSNSPELIEGLHRTAAISERAFGLAQTIVTLPGNAGFNTACNVAANFAQSDRLIFVNPDVFPCSDDWHETHQAILDAKPNDQTKMFGARLLYADGCLMHAGMYIDCDIGVSVDGFAIERRPMLKALHYGKGAPPDIARFHGSRAVPAITGAFMSVDRKWFEFLGGFSDTFVLGHLEDADLCLRSLDNGVPAYMHELELWHLESRGSTKFPYHEGAAFINYWQFTRTWYDKLVRNGLLGQDIQIPQAGLQ